MSLTQPKFVNKGIFTWNMGFNWAPNYMLDVNNPWSPINDTQPIKSPTMAGGLFAIKKSYFNYLGTYDKEMKVWGGENLGTKLTIICDVRYIV